MILVIGAAGVVGQPLLIQLKAKNRPYLAVSRTKNTDRYVPWDLQAKLTKETKERIKTCHTIIHCAPLWLLPQHITQLVELGVNKVIAFSSTSVVSKIASDDPVEKILVDRLNKAEIDLLTSSKKHDFSLTVFRSAMIYGYGLDQNVTHIARQISKLKCMPIAGNASGLRQPVHADDLIGAVIVALNEQKLAKNFYTLAGAERLSYKNMVSRIFLAQGRRARFIRLPVFLYRCLLRAANLVTGFGYLPNMANRMNTDMVYDISDAQKDLQFSPQAFLQNPQRDIL